MERVLNTPPSEDNTGEMCFGECKDKIEKLKKDFLMLKRKIFCSQDLIKKYNNKLEENKQMSINIQTLQSQIKSTEKKLNKRNVAVQSDAVRLRLENDKLRKAVEDVAKLKEEYEIKTASDKQYIQQLVCKLKEIEDQNLDKLMKIELEKSGLQSKVKDLERELRNLKKNKTGSISPEKSGEPKKRGRKSFNQKTIDLPVLENDINCIDMNENIPEPLKPSCENRILQEECRQTSSIASTKVQKPIDIPEIIFENEFAIKVSTLEPELPEKPVCIDKNIMTDEYYDLKNDPYPLFCHKCRNLLNTKPVDEILNGMQMKPLITEFSPSPVRERNETNLVSQSSKSLNVEALEKKVKKLEKLVSRVKQAQNSYKNASHCNYSHANSWYRDNSINDSFSLMNFMTTFFNTMNSNKKKKKNRTKKLQHCKRKIYRKRRNYTNNDWNVESISDYNSDINTPIHLGSLQVPLYTPLINRTNENCYFNREDNIENSEKNNDHQIESYNNIEIEKTNEVLEQSNKKLKNNQRHIKHQMNNDDYIEYQKHGNDHTENQQVHDDTLNECNESYNEITNTEKIVDLNDAIGDSENDKIRNTKKVNDIIPIEKLANNIHRDLTVVSEDVNTRLNQIHSLDATSIEVISLPLNSSTVQKRKRGKINSTTNSVKSSLLTRLRQLKNKSTKLPAKIFRNQNLDMVERIEDLNETSIKRKRIAHVPKQDCSDETDETIVKQINDEQLISDKLRVTRSMAKSILSPNAFFDKESQNSFIGEENLIINNVSSVINDYSSCEQSDQDNENSMMHRNQKTFNAPLDNSEKINLDDEEQKESIKTQEINDKLNDNSKNEIASKSHELNDKEEKTSKKVSKMNNTDVKNSDMLIDLEKLMEDEVAEGIALINNPELFDELSESSDQKLQEFSAPLEQKESLVSLESETEKSVTSLNSKSEEFLASLSCLNTEKFSASQELESEKLPALSDPKHNVINKPSELPASNVSNYNPVSSNECLKTPISKEEFYKNCVINLRNRTVPISPSKSVNESNNESFIQNTSLQLLDRYLAQKKPKVIKKWSKYHQEAAMKLAKGAEEYVKMELKNLIDAETWTSLENEQTVNNLKTINNRSIAKSVVELLIELSDLKEPLDRTFTPPAPMMTKNQQKIVALLKKLDGIKNIINDILDSIEYTIFQMNSDVTYEAAEELARIFTVLAKIKKDRERVRILCCDALYCLQKKGLFMLSAIITSWPEILPFHQEDRFQYLPACIVYAVKTFKHAPNDTCIKIMQLNKLIRSMYKYPDEFLTSKNFAEKLLTDFITSGHDKSVSTAIILLSKKEGSEWTYKNIISGGLLGMIVENNGSNICEALKLLGYLMKSFPIVDQSGTVKKIMDQLCAILDSGATSIDIQEGVVFALLSLSRHNFDQVAKSISTWQPQQSLSSELEEQLNIFFGLRTLNFWKKFKNKKKSINTTLKT